MGQSKKRVTMNTKLKHWSYFLCGFALAFDFTGVFGNSMLKKDLEKSSARMDALLNSLDRKKLLTDKENLAGDWANIGTDFRSVLQQLR